jgi:hypothetical protein
MSDPVRQTASASPPVASPGLARRAPRTRSGLPLHDAQAALGNAVVQRRLLQRAVQRQALEVAPPEDEHEREAERLADRLTERLSPPPVAAGASQALRRAAAPEEEKRKPETAD